jgi:pimeloyl-ACP methyl ester carboxylesterase
LKQRLVLQNGITLSYAEYGARQGYPILVQHGLIASIGDANLFTRLVAAGYRLICAARPGYGESSAYEMENIAEWGEIVAALVAELGIEQFDVLGMSSGAPYSYAIGCKMTTQVRHIYIFSGTPALYAEPVAAHWPHPIQKNATVAQMISVAKEVFFANVTEADLLRDDIRDSMMHNCFGVAQELRLRGIDWGFELGAVQARVFMEHSRADQEVPLITAVLTAQMLPNCQLSLRDGEHFSEETLDDFLCKVVLRQLEGVS